jgi:hypothetical protein
VSRRQRGGSPAVINLSFLETPFQTQCYSENLSAPGPLGLQLGIHQNPEMHHSSKCDVSRDSPPTVLFVHPIGPVAEQNKISRKITLLRNSSEYGKCRSCFISLQNL